MGPYQQELMHDRFDVSLAEVSVSVPGALYQRLRCMSALSGDGVSVKYLL